MLSSSLGAQTLEMSVAVYCSSSQLLSTSRMGNASRVRPPVPAPTSHTRKPAWQSHRSEDALVTLQEPAWNYNSFEWVWRTAECIMRMKCTRMP